MKFKSMPDSHNLDSRICNQSNWKLCQADEHYKQWSHAEHKIYGAQIIYGTVFR